jgi:hypothetical protein
VTIFEPSYDVFEDAYASEVSYAVIVDNLDKVMTSDENSAEGSKVIGNINYKMRYFREAQVWYCQGLLQAVKENDFLKAVTDLSSSLWMIDEHDLSLLFAMVPITIVCDTLSMRHLHKDVYVQASLQFQERFKVYVSHVDGSEGRKRMSNYENVYPDYVYELMADPKAVSDGHFEIRRDILENVVRAYTAHLKDLNHIDELINGDGVVAKAFSALKDIDPITSTLLLNSAAAYLGIGYYFEATLSAIACTMLSKCSKPAVKALYRLIKALLGCDFIDEAMIISQLAMEMHPNEKSLHDQHLEVLAAKAVYMEEEEAITAAAAGESLV